MADIDRDDSTDDDSSEEKTKGLSRSTLIKIAIAVFVLLIIAGSAYFFFLSSDELAKEEMQSEELTIDETTGLETLDTSEESHELQLLKMREEAVALKEENLQMKERLMNLKEQQISNAEAVNPANIKEQETPASDDSVNNKNDGKMVDVDTPSEPEVKESNYSNAYSRDYAPVRKTRSEAPPEPKWGDFDPLYSGN